MIKWKIYIYKTVDEESERKQVHLKSTVKGSVTDGNTKESNTVKKKTRKTNSGKRSRENGFRFSHTQKKKEKKKHRREKKARGRQ